MLSNLRRFLSLFFVLFLTLAVRAESGEKNLPFKNIGINNGLSGSSVTSIERGPDGLLWIATTYGLNSFDGYRVKQYATASGDLPNVQAMTVDSLGRVWALDYDSLYVLAPIYNKVWTLYPQMKSMSPAEATAGRCKEKFVGMRNTDRHGILLWDATTLSSLDGTFSFALPELLNDVVEDNTGLGLYLLSQTGRLYWTDGNGKPTLMASVGRRSKTLRLFLDSRNRLWVYDMMSELLRLFAADGSESSAEEMLRLRGLAPIVHIQEHRGKLYFSTNDKGLVVVDDKGDFSFIRLDTSNPVSLPNNHLSLSYIDSLNRLWVGTTKVGACWTSLDPFTLHRFQTLVRDDVTCFGETSDHELVIGYDGGGLQVGTRLLTTANSPLTSNLVIALNPTADGYLIGTYGGGLLRLSPDGKEIAPLPLESDSLRKNLELTKFAVEDANRRLWVGTMRQGLFVLEKNADGSYGLVKQFDMGTSIFRTGCITCLAATPDHRYILAGTSTGLYRIDTKTLDAVALEEDDNYLSLLVDQNGGIWTGTHQGLALISIDGRPLTAADSKLRAVDGHIIGLAEDRHGNIIVATPYSLRLVHRYGHDNFYIRQLSSAASLAGMTFTQEALYSSADGQILAGGNGCYTSSLANNSFASSPTEMAVAFTSIVLDGKNVMEIQSKIPSNHSVTIEVSDYDCWDDRRYEYRLDHGAWMPALDNSIVLGHLIPGGYTLEVRRADADDAQVSVLRFRVGNWWEHWIFNLLIFSLFVIALFLFLRKMYRRLRSIKPFQVSATTEEETTPDAQFLARIAKIIEDNIRNEQFSVEELAAHVGMSRSNLFRRLKSLTDQTPIELIQSIRLQKARQKLDQGATSISQVAYEVGLSPRQLTALFKKHYGQTPTQMKAK